MKFRSTVLMILVVLCLVCVGSCKREASNANVAQGVGMQYPKTAKESMGKLSGLLAHDVDVVGFAASYGVLTEILGSLKEWGVFSADEMDAVFSDFGIHYQLNPAVLSAYGKAGFNVGGGFAFALHKGSAFFLFQLRDREAFRQFWDNFMNEEYGRPRYHEETQDGVDLVQINVLKKDACTLAFLDDLVFVFAGPAMMRAAAPSLERAKEYLSHRGEESLASNPEFLEVQEALGGEQLVFYAPNIERVRSLFKVEGLGLIDKMFSSLSLGMSVQSARLDVRSIVKIKPDAPFDLGAFEGAEVDVESAQAILGASPQSAAKLSFNSTRLESALLATFEQGAQEQWLGIKDKLEQRLLNMRFQSQILDNLAGSVWVNVYGMDAERMRGATTLSEALPSISAAVFIPFKDTALSDTFFSKVNALGRLIPPGRLELANDEGIIMAHGTVSDCLKLRAAYYNGVLAIFTDLSLGAVKDVLLQAKTTADTKMYEALLDPQNAVALKIDVQNVIQYLGVKYEIISAQLSRFLAPLREVRANVRLSGDRMILSAQVDLKAVPEQQ